MVSRGLVFLKREGRERVRWMNGVRYVKYVCRIFRGLECRVSLAEAPVEGGCRWWSNGGEGRKGWSDGFGYASPRPGWICRRHLLSGMRDSVEKRGFPLVPPRNNFERDRNVV